MANQAPVSSQPRPNSAISTTHCELFARGARATLGAIKLPASKLPVIKSPILGWKEG